jgi:CPA2 family monovalent cation:H+ antiporter-2
VVVAGAGAALGDLALTVAKAVAFIAATLFLGARVIPRVMHVVERLGSPELFLLTAVALALGTAATSALLGLSPALGAFMGGLMLTETEFDHRVVAEVVPMRNLFATLFFVSVGMLIDPAFIARNLAAVLGLAAAIMAIKVLATLAAVLPFRLGGKTTVFVGLGLLQIGEFSYVLARAVREVGGISESLHGLILTSSLVTIVLTPAAFWVAPRVDLALARLPLLGPLFAARPAVLGEEERFAGHVVVVGYGRVGRRVVDGLRATGVPVVVVEEDLHLVQELTAAGVPAIYGDASYRSVLDAAHPERARLLVVALPDAGAARVMVRNARRANPHAPILVRAPRLEDEETLRRSGATAVVAPELAGARLLLEEAVEVLDLAVPLPGGIEGDGDHAGRRLAGSGEPLAT